MLPLFFKCEIKNNSPEKSQSGRPDIIGYCQTGQRQVNIWIFVPGFAEINFIHKDQAGRGEQDKGDFGH